MESFMEGLFGNRQAVDAEEVPVNDTLLTVSESSPPFSFLFLSHREITS